MPDEVVSEWLVERVESRGWPPQGPYWDLLLRGYSPEDWRAFTWEKMELELSSLPFSQKSSRLMTSLAAARFRGVINEYSGIENSHDRMQSIAQYVNDSGRLPGFVTLIHDGDWEIVDGSHRSTLYMEWSRDALLSAKINRVQSAWVATPSKA
jgi:hypothetical protein